MVCTETPYLGPCFDRDSEGKNEGGTWKRLRPNVCSVWAVVDSEDELRSDKAEQRSEKRSERGGDRGGEQRGSTGHGGAMGREQGAGLGGG